MPGLNPYHHLNDEILDVGDISSGNSSSIIPAGQDCSRDCHNLEILERSPTDNIVDENFEDQPREQNELEKGFPLNNDSNNIIEYLDDRIRPKLQRRDTTWTNRDIPGNRITEWQAGWNVTNAIQGMFIVSLPYAVLYGGYWAVFAMIIVAYICYYTGTILVDCLYDEKEELTMQEIKNYHGKIFLEEKRTMVRIRTRNSYVSIAQSVWGEKWGSILVNSAQIIELLMTCILYLVLCGDLMFGSFQNSAFNSLVWIIFATIMLLPCAFVKTLTGISRLSFACTIVHIIINAIVIIYCASKIKHWFWGQVRLKIDMWNFPVSMGVIVFSYTSHIFLPALEGGLESTSKFKGMLKWSHIAAALFKSVFGYVGFLTFGKDTQEVITNNFNNLTFKGILNITLVIKALFSYPLPYFAASELLETALFRGKSEGTPFPTCLDIESGNFKLWALGLRLLLILITLAMAVMIPYFNILMGLIGSFTGTLLSFVWPCYFHIKLKGNSLESKILYLDISIIILGGLFGSFGMYIYYSPDGFKERMLIKCEKIRQYSWDHPNNLSVITLKHLIVNDNLKLIYCYVPKVSSTQWKKIFYMEENSKLIKESNLSQAHVNNLVHDRAQLTYLSSFNDSSEVEKRLNHYKKFMFVREPLERLLSAYLNKFGSNDNLYFKKSFAKYILKLKHKSQRRFKETFNYSTENIVEFRDFVKFILNPKTQKSSYLMNEHWLPITSLCDPCAISYDFIGRQEQMIEDGNQVLSRYFKKSVLKSDNAFNLFKYVKKILRQSHHNADDYDGLTKTPFIQRSHTNDLMNPYFRNISIREIEDLIKVYQNDYILFDYNDQAILETLISF
ncbi:unnamed protein product [Gordionus sp. m RMFG-2023]